MSIFQNMSIHLLSPFFYAAFVEGLRFLPRIPDNKVMIWCRTVHNISLSVLSLMLFVLSVIGTYMDQKFNSVDALLCDEYDKHNNIIKITAVVFLLSKYIEWGDTLFLHLSNKPITMLQYTHHMSTVILTYVACIRITISPHSFVFVGTNTFIHTLMYWYFAFPAGILQRYRKMITIGQLVQHVLCLFVLIHTSLIEGCEQPEDVNLFGLSLYSMYLIFFLAFYLKTYTPKKNTVEGKYS